MTLDVDRALDFLTFVRARHDVWEARQAGLPQPWTDEPVVATRKFTNVFRVLDPGSQFVLTDLLEPGISGEEFVMRCFLYRHTGRVDAWQYLALALGRYPLDGDFEDALEAFQQWRSAGHPVFTGAYLVYPQSATPGTDKLVSIVRLTQRLRDDGTFKDFVRAKTQAERFATLRRNKGVADFMSMQVLTDYGYGTEFREDDFVVAGPGARKGAAALGLRPEDAVLWAATAIRSMPNPPTIAGRLPSYMDAQNTLCEFSKWVRYTEKPFPVKPYTPAHPGPQPAPVLPPRW
jgi:hypothetical protein